MDYPILIRLERLLKLHNYHFYHLSFLSFFTSKILLGPGQDALQVKGLCTVKISTKSKTTTQDIYVISGFKMALLGRPAIHALGIISRIDTVNLDSLESVKRQFPDLFQGPYFQK